MNRDGHGTGLPVQTIFVPVPRVPGIFEFFEKKHEYATKTAEIKYFKIFEKCSLSPKRDPGSKKVYNIF